MKRSLRDRIDLHVCPVLIIYEDSYIVTAPERATWRQVAPGAIAAAQVAPSGARREVANGAIHLAPDGGDDASRHAPGGGNGTTVGSTVVPPSSAETDEDGGSAWAQVVRDLTDRLDRSNAELLLRTEAASAWQGRAEILAAELTRTREQLALMAPKTKPEQARPWWAFWRA